MSDFTAGFAVRQNAAARALHTAFAKRPQGFAPRAVATGNAAPNVEPQAQPSHFSPSEPGPKHFSPADRSDDPTSGWDPFASDASDTVVPTVFIDPVETAYDAGYAEGYAAAEAVAQAGGARDRALLEKIGEALRTSSQCDREQFALKLRETVLHLVRRIVGETGVSPDLLLQRVGASTDLLVDSAEAAMLHLHPDDLVVVANRLPDTVFPVGDPTIERGGFLLETATTVVEDGPEAWLQQLGAAIDKMAMPTRC